MESFRHQRSPGSDRFLDLFASSPSLPSSTDADELHEDEIFWTVADPAADRSASPKPSHPIPNPNPNPPAAALHRNFGILAALPEDDNDPSPRPAALFLHRNTSISSTASSASNSPSSARTIHAIPKPKPAPAGNPFHQSAPVNVPIGPPKPRKLELQFDPTGADDDDDEMLPPHEIVDRALHKDSPMTTFSVLEGVGRTLKGRDLRRVRNAVWHKTGFLD